ncbi:hypothetical protein HDU96_005750 [Phlyctochytrium bullatum]|nr:hypothetical protein HDU96_005750 [Phlyctochytrium bullatum]
MVRLNALIVWLNTTTRSSGSLCLDLGDDFPVSDLHREVARRLNVAEDAVSLFRIKDRGPPPPTAGSSRRPHAAPLTSSSASSPFGSLRRNSMGGGRRELEGVLPDSKAMKASAAAVAGTETGPTGPSRSLSWTSSLLILQERLQTHQKEQASAAGQPPSTSSSNDRLMALDTLPAAGVPTNPDSIPRDLLEPIPRPTDKDSAAAADGATVRSLFFSAGTTADDKASAKEHLLHLAIWVRDASGPGPVLAGVSKPRNLGAPLVDAARTSRSVPASPRRAAAVVAPPVGTREPPDGGAQTTAVTSDADAAPMPPPQRVAPIAELSPAQAAAARNPEKPLPALPSSHPAVDGNNSAENPPDYSSTFFGPGRAATHRQEKLHHPTWEQNVAAYEPAPPQPSPATGSSYVAPGGYGYAYDPYGYLVSTGPGQAAGWDPAQMSATAAYYQEGYREPAQYPHQQMQSGMMAYPVAGGVGQQQGYLHPVYGQAYYGEQGMVPQGWQQANGPEGMSEGGFTSVSDSSANPQSPVLSEAQVSSIGIGSMDPRVLPVGWSHQHRPQPGLDPATQAMLLAHDDMAATALRQIETEGRQHLWEQLSHGVPNDAAVLPVEAGRQQSNETVVGLEDVSPASPHPAGNEGWQVARGAGAAAELGKPKRSTEAPAAPAAPRRRCLPTRALIALGIVLVVLIAAAAIGIGVYLRTKADEGKGLEAGLSGTNPSTSGLDGTSGADNDTDWVENVDFAEDYWWKPVAASDIAVAISAAYLPIPVARGVAVAVVEAASIFIAVTVSFPHFTFSFPVSSSPFSIPICIAIPIAFPISVTLTFPARTAITIRTLTIPHPIPPTFSLALALPIAHPNAPRNPRPTADPPDAGAPGVEPGSAQHQRAAARRRRAPQRGCCGCRRKLCGRGAGGGQDA